MNFTILVEDSMLITIMQTVWLLDVQELRRRFSKIALILVVLAPPLRPQGGRDHEIHNFCSPLPIDALYQIWLKLVQWLQRRSWKCSNVKARQRTKTDSNRSPEFTQVTSKHQEKGIFWVFLLDSKNSITFHVIYHQWVHINVKNILEKFQI